MPGFCSKTSDLDFLQAAVMLHWFFWFLDKLRSFTNVENFEANHGVFSKGKPSDYILLWGLFQCQPGVASKTQLVLRPIMSNKSTIDLSGLTIDTDNSNYFHDMFLIVGRFGTVVGNHQGQLVLSRLKNQQNVEVIWETLLF